MRAYCYRERMREGIMHHATVIIKFMFPFLQKLNRSLIPSLTKFSLKTTHVLTSSAIAYSAHKIKS